MTRSTFCRGLAYEIDANYNLVLNGEGEVTILPTADVFNNGAGLPTAAFEIASSFNFTN